MMIEETSKSSISNCIRPNILPGTHPIDTGAYLIATNEINRMFKTVITWIQSRTPGAMIVGNPRLGKTRAIRYLMSVLPTIDIVGDDAPIFSIKCNKFKNINENDFFELFLKEVNHGSPSTGKAIAKRRRLYNFLIEKGLKSSRKRIIIFVDDAQRLHELHYEWLMDIYNELESVGILLTIFLIGQRELLHQRTAFINGNKKQIIGRFMVHEYYFKGILNINDIEKCLQAYDDASIYPLGTSWTFTRYFFPDQYNKGFRLANYAKELYEIFEDISRENNQKSNIEVPMFYFTGTIESALRYLGTDGINISEISKQDWRECIQQSGYIDAEKYSNLLKEF
ncbi:ATP-binding protein [Bacillus cereus]